MENNNHIYLYQLIVYLKQFKRSQYSRRFTDNLISYFKIFFKRKYASLIYCHWSILLELKNAKPLVIEVDLSMHHHTHNPRTNARRPIIG